MQGGRSPNNSSTRNDPMKYARNVMMNISNPSMPNLKLRSSPNSEAMLANISNMQNQRSPFASNGMEIAGVLSSSALGHHHNNPSHGGNKESEVWPEVPSKFTASNTAIQQFTNADLQHFAPGVVGMSNNNNELEV